MGKTTEQKRLRQRAYAAVAKAVAAEDLPHISTRTCAECGEQARHYHHPDYLQSLVVTPVCYRCHGELHTQGQGPKRIISVQLEEEQVKHFERLQERMGMNQSELLRELVRVARVFQIVKTELIVED